MNTAVTSFVLGDPMAILDRHEIRRTTGVPTVSLLVGPIGAGGETWRRWAAGTGRRVVVAKGDFDYKCKENVRTWLIGRVKEPRAIEKLKPMLAAAKGSVTEKLAGQATGEFYLV